MFRLREKIFGHAGGFFKYVSFSLLLGAAAGALFSRQNSGSMAKAYFVSDRGVEMKEVSAKDLASGVEISFLGNCGFFISAGGKHILFDAPQKLSQYPDYSTPEDAVRRMIEREDPFKKIDLLLLSHDHPDHITSELAFRVLENHPETYFVSNEMALSKIRSRNPAEYEKAKNRIVEAAPGFGELKTVTVNGISFRVFKQIHDSQTKEFVLAYLLDLNGLKILLHGDSALDDNLESLAQLGLENEHIDLWFFTDRPHDTLNKVMTTMIKPRAYVIMHNAVGNDTKLKKTVEVYPDAIGFVGSMEKKIFIKK